MNKKYFLVFLIGFFFIGFLLFLNFNQKLFLEENNKGFQAQIKKQKILIENVSLIVEIADTDFKKIKGLSGRVALDKNEGMLFIFEKPGYYSFWMKDMNFPLDFIWINGDKIIDLSENIDKDYKDIFTAKEKFDKVIEVNAGWIKNNNIKIGDAVIFYD